MSGQHSYGEAIKIINFAENCKIIVEQESMNKIFLHEDVKDRSIVILSVIGAFRKGKSFLLNYCLKFLYANVRFNFF
jgi:atlastin